MILTRMPARIIAGDSLRLSIPAGNFAAADGWAVAMTLTPIVGGTPLAVNATDGTGSWSITLTSVQSAALVAGTHRYLIAATKSGERSSIDFGQVQILANPASANTDLRTAALRALDAIDAVLANRATSEDLRFEFADGRSIEKVPHRELLLLRQHYARIAAREKTGGRGPKRVQVRL